ncbi:hypothetical protein [Streptomyces nojiriensis]|uniref:hypothetical protein n=1 Tax=Streptomyces nojiriensis TaxID=66374 RepID=UPI00399AF3CC
MTRALESEGATLSYDVRAAADVPAADAGAAGGARPAPLFLIGSPMDAVGFGTLASHFTDRTVITYDPRGAAAACAPTGWSRTCLRNMTK